MAEAETSMNPVDNSKFTRPLAKALTRHVDAFAEDLAGGDHRRLARVRPCAVSWVYYSVLTAWAADHGLVAPWWSKRGVQRAQGLGLSPREHLEAAYGCLLVHPATACLGDARYSHLADGQPSDEVCWELITWWRDHAPSLAWPDPENGPASISGWLAGDLLQALSTERRKGYALAQTPWWVADFILDRTLIPAADEFRDEPVLRTVDPACGTGHFLIRKVDYLWELYTTGELHPRQATGGQAVTGYPVLAPADAIKRIIAGVHGMERDPLTAAVARLRMVVTIGELMRRTGLTEGPLTLRTIPAFRPVIGVGDSLLWGKIPPEEYAALHPLLADIQPPPPVGRVEVTPEPGGQLGLFGEEAA